MKIKLDDLLCNDTFCTRKEYISELCLQIDLAISRHNDELNKRNDDRLSGLNIINNYFDICAQVGGGSSVFRVDGRTFVVPYITNEKTLDHNDEEPFCSLTIEKFYEDNNFTINEIDFSSKIEQLLFKAMATLLRLVKVYTNFLQDPEENFTGNPRQFLISDVVDYIIRPKSTQVIKEYDKCKTLIQ